MQIKLERWDIEQAIADYINKELGCKVDPYGDDQYFNIKVELDAVSEERQLKTKKNYVHKKGKFYSYDGLDSIRVYCGKYDENDLY